MGVRSGDMTSEDTYVADTRTVCVPLGERDVETSAHVGR